MKLSSWLDWGYTEPSAKENAQLVSSLDYVGVEVEGENCQYVRSSNFKQWEMTEDPSLRDGGLELRFDQPLSGDEVVKAVEEIDRELNKEGVRIEFNDRCSTHIHTDVRGLSEEQYKTYLENWVLFEPMLFNNYVSEQRRSNNFCVPFLHNTEKMVALGESLRSRNVWDSVRNTVEAMCSKYDALNLLCMFGFGSVEHRYFEGTKDKSQLLQHINLCLSFCDMARRGIKPDFAKYTFAEYVDVAFGKFNKLHPNVLRWSEADAVEGMSNLTFMCTRRRRDLKSTTKGMLQRTFDSKIKKIQEEQSTPEVPAVQEQDSNRITLEEMLRMQSEALNTPPRYVGEGLGSIDLTTWDSPIRPSTPTEDT